MALASHTGWSIRELLALDIEVFITFLELLPKEKTA